MDEKKLKCQDLCISEGGTMARYLSYNDLDAIAARVFRAYSKLPEVQEAGQLLYIDPNLLLKQLLG